MVRSAQMKCSGVSYGGVRVFQGWNLEPANGSNKRSRRTRQGLGGREVMQDTGLRWKIVSNTERSEEILGVKLAYLICMKSHPKPCSFHPSLRFSISSYQIARVPRILHKFS